MDFLKKIDTLINATTRSKLPRRERKSILDKQEEEVLAQIRAALADVEAQEQVLAGRVKEERTQAEAAEARGDRANQRAHERRATEIEHQLEQESIQAINLEEKLAALEEKLALAKEAVEKEAQAVALRDEEAEKALVQGGVISDVDTPLETTTPEETIIDDDFSNDEPDVAKRKSRLAG